MAAPALVSGQEGFAFFDGLTGTATAGLPNVVGSGNTIVVAFKGGTSTISSVLDDKGNALTAIDSTTGGSGAANTVKTYYRTNCTDGPQGVTITGSGNLVYPRVWIREYSGAALDASCINAHEIRSFNSATTTANALTSAGTAATSAADCRIIGFCIEHGASNGFAAGTGFGNFTALTTTPNVFDVLGAEDKAQAVAGAAHATFTAASATADDYTVAMIALAPPAPSGYTLTASPAAGTGAGATATLTYTPAEAPVERNVSDAQFAEFLAGRLAKTVLCNISVGYDSGGDTPAVTVARISNRKYSTLASDTPASTPYRDALRDAASLSRQISRETLDGPAERTVSPVVLDNTGGRLNWLLDAVIDGYQMEFLVGFGGDESEPWRAPWAYVDFRRTHIVYMERAEISKRDEITVQVRDGSLNADKGIVGASVGGGASGLTAPICVGTLTTVRAVETDHANLIYRYADASYLYGPMASEVRDNGEPLYQTYSAFGTSTFAAVSDSSGARVEITGTLAKPISVGDVMRVIDPTVPPPLGAGDPQKWVVATDGTTWFELSDTEGGAPLALVPSAIGGFIQQGYYDNHDGTMKMTAAPVGSISCFVQNRLLTDTRGDRLSDLLWWAWVDAAGQSESTFAGPHESYALADGVLDRSGGVYIQERMNVLSDVIAAIARSAAAFTTTTLDGQFTFGRINTNPLDRPATSSATFGDDAVLDDVQCPRLDPKYSDVATFAALNHPPLTQVVEDDAIPGYEREALKAKGRLYTHNGETGGSYALAPSRWHRTMTRSPDFENIGITMSTNWWPRFIRLRFMPHVEFLIFDTPFHKAYRLELGAKVTVNMPLFCGHTEDTFWQVLGHSFQLVRGGRFQNRVSLVLVRRRVPSVAAPT